MKKMYECENLKMLKEVWHMDKPGQGVFSLLQASSSPPPWSEVLQQPFQLDFYYINRSGMKMISPYVESKIEGGGNWQETIIELLQTLYYQRWQKLYDTLTFEYNPIANYDMKETYEESGTNDGTREGTDSTTYGRTVNTTNNGTTETNTDGTDTTTYGKRVISDLDVVTEETQNSTRNQTTDVKNGTYGFDSNVAVDADEGNQTLDETVTNTNNGSVTNIGNETQSGTDTVKRSDTVTGSTDMTTSETQGGSDKLTQTHTESFRDSRTHKLTRTGNIGVTTSQQMIQSERNLWDWKYWDMIFDDIDEVLTLAIY